MGSRSANPLRRRDRLQGLKETEAGRMGRDLVSAARPHGGSIREAMGMQSPPSMCIKASSSLQNR